MRVGVHNTQSESLMVGTLPLRKGDSVDAFFNFFDHPKGYRPLGIAGMARTSPVLGKSQGWMAATIVEDFDPGRFDTHDKETWVLVRFNGRFADPLCESIWTELEPMRVTPTKVRTVLGDTGCAPPSLSVLVVRWHDYYERQGYSDFDITREGSVRDFFMGDAFSGDHCVDAVLEDDYEVFTAFVSTNEDLRRISEHWANAQLQGRHRAAMYYLWPGQIQTPKGAFVCERTFFDLVERMELVGVPMRYPHPGHLYRQLTGKLWVPAMSLHPEYNLPKTTRVHVQDVVVDAAQAAESALRALSALTGRDDVEKGVCKLGFSWCGKDVEAFHGSEELASKMGQLFGKPGSQSTTCLVQELIPDVVCELRCLAFYDRSKGTYKRQLVYMCEEKGRSNDKEHGFSLTTHLTISAERALEVCFQGDEKAQAMAHEEAHRLTTAWLRWMRTECPEVQPQNRFDFLVSYNPTNKGESRVFTCEVTEGGSSLCGLKTAPRTCAYLNQLFVGKRCSVKGCLCSNPKPLPPIENKYGNW